MKRKSKPILGQLIHGRLYLTDSEKRTIIDDYLLGSESKLDVFYRYTGHLSDHGRILKWMRAFGISDKHTNEAIFDPMPKRKKEGKGSSDDFESLQLKKRIAELEAQLKAAEMKAIAFSTMVDIAENEFNIPIRKKYNTKPSKQ